TGTEIEGVHFNYRPYDEAAARYDPARLTQGFNTLPSGEEIYYIPNPALGLWADRNRFAG
ncbi:MAG: D-mannonate epimerase, partial [Spirochaetaceae bacterium]|nr:D-mannonate epimerase [Spirochaetaceae bacterium]